MKSFFETLIYLRSFLLNSKNHQFFHDNKSFIFSRNSNKIYVEIEGNLWWKYNVFFSTKSNLKYGKQVWISFSFFFFVDKLFYRFCVKYLFQCPCIPGKRKFYGSFFYCWNVWDPEKKRKKFSQNFLNDIWT